MIEMSSRGAALIIVSQLFELIQFLSSIIIIALIKIPVIMQKKIISFALYFISFSLELNMELPAVQQQPIRTASTEQVIVYKGSVNQSIKDLI